MAAVKLAAALLVGALAAGCSDGPGLDASNTTKTDASTDQGLDRTQALSTGQEKKMTITVSVWGMFADAASGYSTEFGECWGGAHGMEEMNIGLNRAFKRRDTAAAYATFLGDIPQAKDSYALAMKTKYGWGQEQIDAAWTKAMTKAPGIEAQMAKVVKDSEKCQGFWRAVGAQTTRQKYYTGFLLSMYQKWARPAFGNTCEQQDSFLDARCTLDKYSAALHVDSVVLRTVPKVNLETSRDQMHQFFLQGMRDVVSKPDALASLLYTYATISEVTIASSGMAAHKLGGNIGWPDKSQAYVGCSEEGCLWMHNGRPHLGPAHVGGKKMEIATDYSSGSKLEINKSVKTAVSAAVSDEGGASLKR